jgi:ABC-2 type transport system permease protein
MKTFFSAYVFLMALFFLIFTSGQLLVRSVLEEKSNRIIEVLVSSCTPSELMMGKVLGLSALGLTQMGFWALIALASTAKFGTTAFPPANQLLLMFVYFVLGYLFYSAIFIALGTPVTTEQEAQQVNGYLVMFLVLPIALVIPVMQHPNALWVKILTYVPLMTPTFMALRIPVQMPSTVEVAATIIILIISTYFMMIAAGRIFRIAILATGKKPSLAELVRWVRKG